MLFNKLIHEHVKTKTVKAKLQSEPWMTGKVRKLLNKRFKLLQSAKPTPKGSYEWKSYKQARNKASNAIKAAKAKHWQNESKNSNNLKSFWKTVRNFNGDTIKSTIGPLRDRNEIVVTVEKEKAELVNNFFANILTS